jgi:hypothetical protein
MANQFFELSQIALKKYRSKTSNIDEAVIKLSKFVATSKIAFRINTALKQVLSVVAYFSELDPEFYAYGIKNMINFTESNIKWAKNNIPLLEKRWTSRTGGDDRLTLSEENLSKYGNMFNKVASKGMIPNAFIDLVTCAWGAKTMYEYKYDKYQKMGFSQVASREKALQDADIIYNETQQSAESLFLSKTQSDRTFLAASFSLFNNASFAYTRQMIEALRGIKAQSTQENRDEIIKNRKRQLIEEGLTPENAEKWAKIETKQSLIKDILRVGIFGYLVQVVWNLGSGISIATGISNLWTMLFGDDDDKELLKEEKKEELKKAMLLGIIQPVRGLVGGKELESFIGMKYEGYNPEFIGETMRSNPLGGDIVDFYKNIEKSIEKSDLPLLANSVLTLGTGFTGTNINSIYNSIYAIYDLVNTSDISVQDVSYDLSIFINAPKSQQKQLALIKREGETLDQYIDRYIDLKRLHKYGVFSKFVKDEPTKREETDITKEVNYEYTDLKETINAVKKVNKEAKEKDYKFSYENKSYQDANRVLGAYKGVSKTRVLTSREKSIIKKRH